MILVKSKWLINNNLYIKKTICRRIYFSNEWYLRNNNFYSKLKISKTTLIFNFIFKYALPTIEEIDKDNKIKIKLFRENCTLSNGILTKDLTSINRNIKDIILIDVFYFKII